MKKKFFARKYIRYLGLFILPILIAGIILFLSCYREVKEDIQKNSSRTFQMGAEITDDVLSKGSDISNTFNNSVSICLPMYKMLSRSSLNYKEYISRELIYSILNNSISNFNYIESIYVYFPNTKGNYFHSSKNVVSLAASLDRDWLTMVQDHENNDGMWIVSRPIQEYAFSPEHNAISIFRRIKFFDGVVVVNLVAQSLSDKLDSITSYEGEVIVVLNDRGELVFGNNAAETLGFPENENIAKSLGLSLFENQTGTPVTFRSADYIVNSIASSDNNLYFISMVPTAKLYSLLYSIMAYVLIGIAIASFLCFCFCWIITNRSFNRLNELLQIFEKAEAGTYNPQTDTLAGKKGQDEYDVIQNQVIDTFIRNDLLKREIQTAELNKTTSELKALQLQINPHFFFNTLQQIDMEIIKNEGIGVKSSLLIHDLSDILRYSLEDSTEYVPLSEEIRLAKTYFKIQAAQFPDRIALLWDYDDSVLNYRVMRLLLQPLIENSIRYSILSLEDSCIIRIKILDKGQFLSFHILDTGKGIDPTSLSLIRKGLSDPDYKPRHIGLKNTNKRITLSSKNNPGLSIISTPGRGTCIKFLFPKISEKLDK